MGLAASQARFLAITSRKAYCEFESMQLAQEKLSITRDMAEISEKYQNALNQTTLVWDYDGSGENPYNLTYDLLMTPSVLNDYNPYLITTRTGSVVLTGALASAAAAISPNGSPVERSEAGFQEFLNSLNLNHVITTNLTSEIESLEYKYDPNLGYGSTPLRESYENIDNNTALRNILSKVELGITNNTTGSNEMSASDYYSEDSIWNNISGDINAGDAAKVSINGALAQTSVAKKITIGDLMNNNVILMYTLADNSPDWTNSESDETNATKRLQQKALETLNFISKTITGIFSDDVTTQLALKQAELLVINNFINNTVDSIIPGGASINYTDDRLNAAVKEATNLNGIYFSDSSGPAQNDTVAISLSNMLAAYLTYFEMALNGYNSDFYVGDTATNSKYVTDDPFYYYLLKQGENAPDPDDRTTVMKADFYVQLYNNICINGWTRNDGVEDEKYLDNALKNGTYFITSLNNDGYFYQGRYNESDCIVEITDTDAIAQAEAEFNTAKVKLTYKEDQIDLNMKNLDTEISSLTTEYDSVKNLISKNVEKVFSMFQ